MVAWDELQRNLLKLTTPFMGVNFAAYILVENHIRLPQNWFWNRQSERCIAESGSMLVGVLLHSGFPTKTG